MGQLLGENALTCRARTWWGREDTGTLTSGVSVGGGSRLCICRQVRTVQHQGWEVDSPESYHWTLQGSGTFPHQATPSVFSGPRSR